MKAKSLILILLSLPVMLRAQIAMPADPLKGSTLLLTHDTLTVGSDNQPSQLGVFTNTTYTATADADWVTATPNKWGFSVSGSYQYLPSARYANLTVSTADGQCSRTIVVRQAPNNAAASLQGDQRIKIKSAKASQSQDGYPITNTYDEKTNTYWHTPWGGSTTNFPVTLTYNFAAASHIDYMNYTPRQDGNNNGNFRDITVSYTTTESGTKFIDLGNYSLRHLLQHANRLR